LLFLHNILKGKNDILVRISPFNQKVQALIPLFFLNCPSMNKMDEKKTLGNFFKLNDLMRKGFSLKGK
jgi:hypothetical protein